MTNTNFVSRYRIGIILPLPYEISEYFVVILDENNSLRYASIDLLTYKTIYKSFQLVLFCIDDKQKICSIDECPQEFVHTRKKDLEDLQFYTTGSISYDEVCNVEYDFEEVKIRNLYNEHRRAITLIEYLSKDSDEVIGERWFLENYADSSFRELTSQTIEILKYWIACSSKWEIPVDGNSIKSICDNVTNFNPYEVFESYRIEITHKRETRVGREDYYEENKSYSISYFDNYLSKWFNDGDYTLHWETSETNFDVVNPYQRFIEEEEAAKKKAYAEYNQQEHFDFLISEFFSILKKRMESIESGRLKYSPYKWFPAHLRVKDAYACLHMYLRKSKEAVNVYYSGPDSVLSIYERYLLYAIKEYENRMTTE